jgi:hypothetical protein
MDAAALYDELHTITETLSGIMLHTSFHETSETSFASKEIYIAQVFFTDAWQGSLRIITTDTLARILAERIFSDPAYPVTSFEMSEALREIANITGGNLKNFLPECTKLSLPKFDVVAEIPALHTIITTLHFEAEGEPYRIDLLRGNTQ